MFEGVSICHQCMLNLKLRVSTKVELEVEVTVEVEVVRASAEVLHVASGRAR